MEERVVSIKIVNQTREVLRKEAATSALGKWSLVPDVIHGNAETSFSLQRDVSSPRFDGSLSFVLGETSTRLSVFHSCDTGNAENSVSLEGSNVGDAHVLSWRAKAGDGEWTDGRVEQGLPLTVEYTISYLPASRSKFDLQSLSAYSGLPIRNSRDQLIYADHTLWQRSDATKWKDPTGGSFQPNTFSAQFPSRPLDSFSAILRPADTKLVGSQCRLFATMGSTRVIEGGYFTMKSGDNKVSVTVVYPTTSTGIPFTLNADVKWGMELKSGDAVECSQPDTTPIEFYWIYQQLHRAFKNGVPVSFLRPVLGGPAPVQRAPNPNISTSQWNRTATHQAFSQFSKQYDTVSGAARFITGNFDTGITFKQARYLAKANGSRAAGSRERVVNCMDQAAMLDIYLSLGNPRPSYLYQAPFGYINTTYLVGIVDPKTHQHVKVNNPFFGTYPQNLQYALLGENDQRRRPFGCHVYNGHSAAFDRTRDGIYDACGGPHPGEFNASGYVAASIDRGTKLYQVTGTRPGTVNDIIKKAGVTQIDSSLLPATTSSEQGRISSVLSLATVQNPLRNMATLRWAQLGEWITEALGSSSEVVFGEVTTGAGTAHAFWLLRGIGQEGLELRVEAYVETRSGNDGLLDIARSGEAARERLGSILSLTDRDPQELWKKGTIGGQGEYSLQYADNIEAGRFLIVSQNVVIDISGGPSSTALEPYARRLLEFTTVDNPPPRQLPVLGDYHMTFPGEGDGDGDGATVAGVGVEFSVRFEVNGGDVAATSVDVGGDDGLLVSKTEVEKLEGDTSNVIFTFLTSQIGHYEINMYVADSTTMHVNRKKVDIQVVEDASGA